MHFDDVAGDSGVCESLVYRAGCLLLQLPRFLPLEGWIPELWGRDPSLQL